MSGFWLDDSDISEIVRDSLIKNIETAKHGHMTDIEIRINGEWRRFEADWVKYLKRVELKMTITENQTIAMAWECDIDTTEILVSKLIAFANLAVASVEAREMKLREAVDAALWNIKCVTCDPDGGVAIDGTDEDRRVMQNALTLMEEALSLPTSTEHLDAIVAERVMEATKGNK